MQPLGGRLRTLNTMRWDYPAVGYRLDKDLGAGQGHARACHAGAVVTLVLAGTLREGFDHEEQVCNRFELHFKPAGVPHVTRAGEQGVRMRLLALHPNWVERFRVELPDRPRVRSCGIAAARALQMFSERTPIDEGVVRRLAANLEQEPSRPAEAVPTWLSEAREQLLEQGCELGELARAFRVHPVYLARCFRRAYGESVGEFRRTDRVRRAVGLLLDDASPLGHVALRLGYADQSHFSREFKRETGWAPGRFRSVGRELGPLVSA